MSIHHCPVHEKTWDTDRHVGTLCCDAMFGVDPVEAECRSYLQDVGELCATLLHDLVNDHRQLDEHNAEFFDRVTFQLKHALEALEALKRVT